MANEPILTCYYCENPAEAECPTCGRLFCSEHGEDVCLRCMSPEAAAPSGAVYRGSVLALVIATLVVVFLLVRPPASKTATSIDRNLPTSTAAINATATPTEQGGGGGGTPVQGTVVPSSVTVTQAPAETETVAASPTPSGRTYTMQAGDTLSDVAAGYGITVAELLEANPGINPDTIAIGTVIRIP